MANSAISSLMLKKNNQASINIPKPVKSAYQMIRIKSGVSGTMVRFMRLAVIVLERHIDELTKLDKQFTTANYYLAKMIKNIIEGKGNKLEKTAKAQLEEIRESIKTKKGDE